MKKLVYLITSLETGGAQKAMVRLCGPLKDDYDIRIVGLIDGDRSLVPDLDAAGLNHVGLSFRRGFSDLTRIGAVRREIAGFRPDVLVCSLFHASVLGAWFGPAAGVRNIVSWEHSGYLGNRRRRLVKRWIDGRVRKVFCDSQAVYDAYRHSFASDKAVLMPIGGVDTGVFEPRRRREGGTLVAASVGRLEPIKGYDLLVESAKALVRQHPDLLIRVAAVGSQESRLRDRIRAAGLERHVALEGHVSDVPRFLTDADVYLQPSRQEGQCVAVIEAMACGLPVLAAPTGGIREAVEDGRSGFLVDPADAGAWNARLLELLRDPDLRARMGKRGREIAVDRYDVGAMVARFRGALEASV